MGKNANITAVQAEIGEGASGAPRFGFQLLGMGGGGVRQVPPEDDLPLKCP